MEKRLPLALFLSFLVILGWSYFFAPKASEGQRNDGAPNGSPSAPESPSAEVRPEPSQPAALASTEEKELELILGTPREPGHYRAVFSNRGARLRDLQLGSYFKRVDLSPEEKADPANWVHLLVPVMERGGELGSLLWDVGLSSTGLSEQSLIEALWVMEELTAPERGVRFTYSPPGGALVFEKTVRFPRDSWHIDVELGIENRSAGKEGARTFLFTPTGCVPPELDDIYPEPQGFVLGRERSGDEFLIDLVEAPGISERGVLDGVPPPILCVGAHSKYFAFVMRDLDVALESTLGGASYRPVLDEEQRKLVVLEVPLALHLPPEGQRRSWKYVIYAGPKERSAFVGDYAAHERVLDADLKMKILFDFTFIARLLMSILRTFHGWVGNWGVAIILLTVCVRAALFPLNRRSQTSMARYQTKMKRVTPRMEEIKKKHADDPQKQREAQARLMQEEGAFPPLGGCMPIFLQMPVFIGLFSALRTASELRQQPFAGWIHDLSRPDQLLYLGWGIPVIGDYLNLLPILMVVLWILQQRGMPQPTDEQQARMQKMMAFMPIMFGFFLYNYAAGLSLYMITSSGLGIFEQRVIKKVWPVDDSEVQKKEKKPSGCGPFSGMMQNLAEKQKEQMKRIKAVQEEQKRQQAKQKGKRKKR